MAGDSGQYEVVCWPSVLTLVAGVLRPLPLQGGADEGAAHQTRPAERWSVLESKCGGCRECHTDEGTCGSICGCAEPPTRGSLARAGSSHNRALVGNNQIDK